MTIKTIGLVMAMQSEAKSVLGSGSWKTECGLPLRRITRKKGPDAVCVLCGIGLEKALAAARIVAAMDVDLIMSMGVAGGLAPEVKTGELVIANTATPFLNDSPGDVPLMGEDALPGIKEKMAQFPLKTRYGMIVSSPKPILTTEHKKEVFESYKADVVDMESAAVALAAAEKKLPFVAVRAVCDPANKSIPPAMTSLVDEMGRPKILTILGTFFKNPKLILSMMSTGKDYENALNSLRKFWRITPEVFKDEA